MVGFPGQDLLPTAGNWPPLPDRLAYQNGTAYSNLGLMYAVEIISSNPPPLSLSLWRHFITFIKSGSKCTFISLACINFFAHSRLFIYLLCLGFITDYQQDSASKILSVPTFNLPPTVVISLPSVLAVAAILSSLSPTSSQLHLVLFDSFLSFKLHSFNPQLCHCSSGHCSGVFPLLFFSIPSASFNSLQLHL